jgi:hypothetical protein
MTVNKLADRTNEGPSRPRPSRNDADLRHYVLTFRQAQRLRFACSARYLGATLKQDFIGPDGYGWRFYTDPVGHPFCLCLNKGVIWTDRGLIWPEREQHLSQCHPLLLNDDCETRADHRSRRVGRRHRRRRPDRRPFVRRSTRKSGKRVYEGGG